VLFAQTRVGLQGREFRFPKFRSVVVDAEQRKLALLSENQQVGLTQNISTVTAYCWTSPCCSRLLFRLYLRPEEPIELCWSPMRTWALE
jgi:ABC-type transport system involved in Fe-S cluster assembly fused permease/ATPase subunit